MVSTKTGFGSDTIFQKQDRIRYSDGVSRPAFWSLGLEGLKSRLGIEGFRFRSRALRLETLNRLFFMKSCNKEFLKKMF